jgi:lipopolysaccharide transport system ATP-binding protein
VSSVLSIQNLGKKYLLGHQVTPGSYIALRDVLSNGVKKIGRNIISPFRSSIFSRHHTQEEFWALRDVSFEVHQGERLGIIGRNGAGKSTLLKILSRITEPTTGCVRIKGRVASLLEVGTGFHPELTGRENIFLNGAILGMSRFEIRKQFDEIVDFAEIERFLDTPVKRYSSGMYVRLAFAVAAHLEPEILIVDEVLAVGDSQFQKKCLGKMEDVSAKEGRTIVFVSHNLSALRALCNKCVWLAAGRIAGVGELVDVTDKYILSSFDRSPETDRKEGTRFLKVFLEDSSGTVKDVFNQDDDAYLVLNLLAESTINLNCGFTLYNSAEIPLFSSCLLDSFTAIDLGVNCFRVRIPLGFLPSGNYRLEGAIWDDALRYDQRECLAAFSVLRNDSTLEIRCIGSKAPLRLPEYWNRWDVHGE